eukprot:COSAG01_NODE_59086_length_302_cov_0.768473_1_plen_32_part_01
MPEGINHTGTHQCQAHIKHIAQAFPRVRASVS